MLYDRQGNKIRQIVLHLIFLTVLIFICACSATQKEMATHSAKNKSKTQQSESNPEVMFLYVNGVKEKILGNLDNAAGIYAEVRRKDGSNHAAMYELADIYVRQKKYSDALFFSRSASLSNPQNKWYKELLADVYEKLKQFILANGRYPKNNSIEIEERRLGEWISNIKYVKKQHLSQTRREMLEALPDWYWKIQEKSADLELA